MLIGLSQPCQNVLAGGNFAPFQLISFRLLHFGLHKEPSSGQGDLAPGICCLLLLICCLLLQNILTGLVSLLLSNTLQEPCMSRILLTNLVNVLRHKNDETF